MNRIKTPRKFNIYLSYFYSVKPFHNLLKLAFVLFIFSSCIPRQKVVYFQTGSWENPLDSAVVTYQQSYSQYVLRPGDIVNISLGSVTPVEFDFIAQYAVQMGEFLYLSPKTGKNGAQVFSGTTGSIQSSTLQTAYSDKQALGFVINKDGNISLPKVGNISASGKSLYELEQLVEDKLDGYFESPKVRVQLLNFQFTILGEVNKEGRYTTFNDKTSLLEAISMADNCSEFADRGQVKVIRTIGDRTSVYYINLLDASFFASPYFYIYPEDIIVIAPLRAKFWRNYVLPDTMKGITFMASILSLFALIYAFNK